MGYYVISTVFLQSFCTFVPQLNTCKHREYYAGFETSLNANANYTHSGLHGLNHMEQRALNGPKFLSLVDITPTSSAGREGRRRGDLIYFHICAFDECINFTQLEKFKSGTL